MDWFERLTGFREDGYEATQAQLFVADGRLRSRVNDASWGIGRFEMPSLTELRQRVRPSSGRLRVAIFHGDVRHLHADPQYAGALFQVASQFNALEMPAPGVTPEAGVAAYAHDHTQGPACAMACGAATIYRNYLVPCHGRIGQTRERQLDGLADVGAELARLTGRPAAELWSMRNGYALASAEGLKAIADALSTLDSAVLDVLRGRLRIAVHYGAEVTDVPAVPGPTVSQAFCSALPVAYTSVPPDAWEPFARLVLEAAYEATLLTAVDNAQGGGSNVVLLTQLGGGVFGNAERWIIDAMHRALAQARTWDIDARIVCYGAPSVATRELVAEFA